MKELLQPWAGPDPPIVPPHLIVDAVERARKSEGMRVGHVPTPSDAEK